MRKIFELHGLVTVDGLEAVKKSFTDIDNKLKQTSKMLLKTGKDMQKIGMGFTKFFTVPIVAAGTGIVKLIETASDLNETISKTNEIFEESAPAIEKWASTAADKFGQSKKTAMDAASTFAMFGQAAGKSGDDVVDFSTKMVELSSDLASFYNTSPEDAINAIGSALRGEAEPIRRYNVLLNDSVLKQKALEMGIISSTKKALTPQQKILASAAVIWDQTGKAQGDFARTSDQLANTTKILQANLKNLGDEFGTVFLPIALKVLNFVKNRMLPKLREWVDWFKSLDKSTVEFGLKFAGLMAILGPAIYVIGGLIIKISQLRAALILLKGTFITNPIGLVLIAVAAIITGIYTLTKHYSNLNKEIRENNRVLDEAAKKGNREGIDMIKKRIIAVQALIKTEKAEISKLKEQQDNETNYANKDFYEKKILKRQKMLESLTKQYDELKTAVIDFYGGPLPEQEPSNYNPDEEGDGETSVSNDAKIKAIDKEIELLKKELKDEEDIAARVKENEELQFQRNLDYNQKEKDDKEKKDAEIEENRRKANEAREKDVADSNERGIKFDNERKVRNQMVMDAISDSFNKLSSVIDGFYKNKADKIDKDYEKQKLAIENSTLSEVEKQKKLDLLELNADKQKRALRKKAAMLDKATALFSIGLNTAVAIMNVWATAPSRIFAAIMTGIVTALGIAQTAVVASKPIPAKKGLFAPSQPGGILTNVAEGNEDEVVFPLQSGVKAMVEELINQVSAQPIRSVTQQAANSRSSIYHLHIGTLVADDYGLKELERRITRVHVMENQRVGGE